MFTNRLTKVYKHFSKLARRQEVACYRFYDHDLPEFPFAIDWAVQGLECHSNNDATA